MKESVYDTIDPLFTEENIDKAASHDKKITQPKNAEELYFKAKAAMLGTFRERIVEIKHFDDYGYDAGIDRDVSDNGGNKPDFVKAQEYINQFEQVEKNVVVVAKLKTEFLLIKIEAFLKPYKTGDNPLTYDASKIVPIAEGEGITQEDIKVYTALRNANMNPIDPIKWKAIEDIYQNRYTAALDKTAMSCNLKLNEAWQLSKKFGDDYILAKNDITLSQETKRVDLPQSIITSSDANLVEFKKTVNKCNVYGEYANSLSLSEDESKSTPKEARLSLRIQKLDAYNKLVHSQTEKLKGDVYKPEGGVYLENDKPPMRATLSEHRDPILEKFYEFIDSMFSRIGIETKFSLTKGDKNLEEFEKIAGAAPPRLSI